MTLKYIIWKNDDDDQENDLEWIEWIQKTTHVQLSNGFEDLKDGVILCKYVNLENFKNYN